MASKKKRKKLNGGGTDAGGGWEIVYSGFVLILLCFFIMLCSFSTMETSKVTRFVKSFSIAVSIFSGGLNFNDGEVVLPVSSDIVSAEDPLANIFDELSEIMKHYGVNEDVSVVSMGSGLVIRLSDAILFDPGATDVNQAAIPVLQNIGKIISKTPYDIRIEGHSDNLPINTIEYPSNWELSTSRAIKVLRYFIEYNHISPSRLSAEGFAEYKPVVPNDSPENRGKNRRVEIKIFDSNQKSSSLEMES